MTAAVISAYEYNLPGLVLLTCHSIVTGEAWIVKIPILDSWITDGAGKLGLTLVDLDPEPERSKTTEISHRNIGPYCILPHVTFNFHAIPLNIL